MSIYQSSVLKKFQANQNQESIDQAFEKYASYFKDSTVQENIRNSKEEQFQEGFLRELFVNVLGYTINPNPGFNLTTELKNVKDAKKTDGAILKDGNALAVIELKGTDTKDLDKVTDQAFNYKNNQPECVYVITSNFEKLRFYIHNAVDHVEFNLFNLTATEFSLLWLFLEKDNLLSGIPEKVKEQSLLQEEQITKRLYKDYSAFKNDLWKDLCANNPNVDELLLYKKSQKLLDRFLFIFFAEDKGLLPPNSISEIVFHFRKLKEMDEYRPLYHTYKKYFGYMNDGRKIKGKAEIHAYNGGLFKPDDVLDGLTISDDVLETHCLKLSEYDFESEVDTNILGHIFEHSLNDIENVRAELAGETVDKSKTKRKKDGVFYTPKYITKYIVDNTVGKLCEEKKAEIKLDEAEFSKGRKGRKKDTLKKLDAQLKTYREWLLELTICDPACGSGAFLNQALEFLMAEHRFVDELESQFLGYAMVFPDVENHILERNIFGVDINEESVEIARLSLWLRTAKKGRKLTSLSSNIKVGNSLIDDPEVAGELAFNWQEQFTSVFEKGGFDVVLGNPPYVRQELVKHYSPFLSKEYEVYTGKGDLYTYFYELGYLILKDQGVLSFISSGKFFSASYGKPLVSFLVKNTSLIHVIDFDDLEVFEGISAYPLILTFQKLDTTSRNKQFEYCFVPEVSFNSIAEVMSSLPFRIIRIKDFVQNDFKFVDQNTASLFRKLRANSTSLAELNALPLVGVKTGYNHGFLTEEVSSSFCKPYIFGKQIKRYEPLRSDSNIIFPYQKIEDQYSLVSENELDSQLLTKLNADRPKLEQRAIIKDGIHNGSKTWYEYQQINKSVDFESEFIVYPNVSLGPNFTLCKGNVIDMTGFIIPSDDKYLLAILNSKLVDFQMKRLAITRRGGYLEYKIQYLNQLPIKTTEEEGRTRFIELVEQIINKSANLVGIENGLIELLISKFSIERLSRKLQNWTDLDFKGFLAELKKQKIKLSLEEEAEWMSYFNKKKTEANTLQAEINRIDKEIDQMVYRLYGLTEEEIKIVEGS